LADATTSSDDDQDGGNDDGDSQGHSALAHNDPSSTSSFPVGDGMPGNSGGSDGVHDAIGADGKLCDWRSEYRRFVTQLPTAELATLPHHTDEVCQK
jgi:hypothetical protein